MCSLKNFREKKTLFKFEMKIKNYGKLPNKQFYGID